MASVIIPTVINWSVTPQNGTEDYFNKMNTWLTESTVVISSFNQSIVKINEVNQEIVQNLDDSSLFLEQTKDYIDSAISDAGEALENASDIKANVEQIERLAYGLTQIPIQMSAVIDGELIMYFNDPIQSLSLVDGELIVDY